MSKPHEDFVEAFRTFLDQTSVADAMSVAAGLFVSLVTTYMEHRGEDATKEITINGGDERDITIHAAKGRTAAKGEA